MNYDISDDVSMPLSTIIEVTDNIDELSQRSISPKTILLTDVSHRLSQRKQLYKQLYVISNTMCALGLFGIVLMIFENEFYFQNSTHKLTTLSFVIRLTMTISTIILLVFIVYYKYIDLQLFTINNSLNSIRIGLTRKKLFVIFLELIICSIHPFPRFFPSFSETILNTSIGSQPMKITHIDIDVALGIPMFMRIYLVCRCMFYHSTLVHNTFSQSLGYLNQVKINFVFLLKTYLEQWPTRCLAVISISFFFICSWCLHACNFDPTTNRHIEILDAMWLSIVTFTTIGYGDLSPSTYCGRTISAIIGLFGIFVTALLVSILAQKLQLTRQEKYIHNFVIDFRASKERKHQAANIIKYSLKIWILKRRNQLTTNDYRQVQRKLIQSVYSCRQLKHKQKNLADYCVGFPEIIAKQRETNKKIRNALEYSTNIEQKIDRLDGTMSDMNQTILKLQNTLDILVNKISE